MFTLLVGCPPFWHRKQMIMLRNIMEGKYSFMSPEWSDISGTIYFFLQWNLFINWKKIIQSTEDPKDLIRKCLVVDPEKRINVRDALKHPFFNTVVSTLIHYQMTEHSFEYNLILFWFLTKKIYKTNKCLDTSQHYLSFSWFYLNICFTFNHKKRQDKFSNYSYSFVSKMSVVRIFYLLKTFHRHSCCH